MRKFVLNLSKVKIKFSDDFSMERKHVNIKIDSKCVAIETILQNKDMYLHDGIESIESDYSGNGFEVFMSDERLQNLKNLKLNYSEYKKFTGKSTWNFPELKSLTVRNVRNLDEVR